MGMRHSADHIFEHEDILDFGHLGHVDIFAAQILDLGRVAAVAVHDAEAVEVVETLEVVESACGLYHFVATAERLYRMFAEDERIEFGVDAVGRVALDEKHRFAGAYKRHVDFLRQTCISRKQVVVPGIAVGVVGTYPHYHILQTGGGEIDIVSGIDKAAIGSHVLDGVP